MFGKAHKFHGARSELNSLFGLEKVDQKLQLIHQAYGVQISPHEISGLFQPWKWNSESRKLPVPLSSWILRQTVCSTVSRAGWSVARSASLAKGGTSKKRPSPHLHKFPTRCNKLSPQTFQTALVQPERESHLLSYYSGWSRDRTDRLEICYELIFSFIKVTSK